MWLGFSKQPLRELFRVKTRRDQEQSKFLDILAGGQKMMQKAGECGDIEN